ncbi:hypothetical protein EDB19DRAFT_2029456 [Suillus lakei]|nr:hypothetical protein EDB19DRAFT_2029456 [Suillus lakei]
MRIWIRRWRWRGNGRAFVRLWIGCYCAGRIVDVSDLSPTGPPSYINATASSTGAAYSFPISCFNECRTLQQAPQVNRYVTSRFYAAPGHSNASTCTSSLQAFAVTRQNGWLGIFYAHGRTLINIAVRTSGFKANGLEPSADLESRTGVLACAILKLVILPRYGLARRVVQGLAFCLVMFRPGFGPKPRLRLGLRGLWLTIFQAKAMSRSRPKATA